MRLEMAGMAQKKQKCLIFIVVSRVKVENQISRGQLAIKRAINLYVVNI